MICAEEWKNSFLIKAFSSFLDKKEIKYQTKINIPGTQMVSKFYFQIIQGRYELNFNPRQKSVAGIKYKV